MEVELLLAVVEALDDAVTLGLALQDGQARQVALEVLVKVLLSSCNTQYKYANEGKA